MPCVGHTTSTNEWARAVRRHGVETGLRGCCLFPLLSGQGTLRYVEQGHSVQLPGCTLIACCVALNVRGRAHFVQVQIMFWESAPFVIKSF